VRIFSLWTGERERETFAKVPLSFVFKTASI